MATAKPQLPAKLGLYAPRVFSKRTRARFYRDRMAELLAGLGGEPAMRHRILIGRVIAQEWELRRIDAKLDRGEELSGHMLRARLAMETRLRLDLRDLMAMPVSAPKPPSLADLTERIVAAREAAA